MTDSDTSLHRSLPSPHATRTTCPYCGVGCGVLVDQNPDGTFQAQGDPAHPSNFGRLCSKGAALGETVGLEGRLLYPEIGGKRVEWDAALGQVAARFGEIIRRHGPDAVAFYVSGQLLTEEYYVANKLMKGFIGSGNIDTNSRLCMSSTVAGQKRAFGGDCVPACYEDLELAELIVLVGSNAAWCHPVLFQRLVQAKQANPGRKLVVIDPRRTATAEIADLHLPLQAGSDVTLFNGLLHYLRRHDKLDYGFLDGRVRGFAAALAQARDTAPSIPAVAKACGLKEEAIASFYGWFAGTEKTVTAWSQGVNQSSSGTDKVNSILNVHLATGRIGKPGAGPLSFTGQPNAMGGREVGGLANQLAAHMEVENPAHRALVGEFWNAPRLAQKAGLKAVDLFQAVGTGQIKALWIMATNPAVSLPDTAAVRRALKRCEFVAVSECEDHTDLKPYAHVRLPALGWGEKNGTVTNSERRISRQRAFLPPPGEARPDWWIVCQVARRMGFADAFAYEAPHEIFREHARLSGYGNDGGRAFDISALGDMSAEGYEALQPVQWPVTRNAPGGTARLFEKEAFPAAGGVAHMPALAPLPPANLPDPAYPLVLNTGRIRDQWHTMTRTSRSPRLNQHLAEPYAELHPADAARLGIEDGALVRLASRHGEALARARVASGQRLGCVFMPMHWNDQFAKGALVNALVAPITDPVSGEPESKFTPVAVEPFAATWHGFVLARERVEFPDAVYCVKIRGAGFWAYELAGTEPAADWPRWARSLAATAAEAEWLDFLDPRAGRYRGACLEGGKLSLCAFVGPDFRLPPRAWLEGLFTLDTLPPDARASLLAGRPSRAEDDGGPVVCACFGVGRHVIERAIAADGLTSTEAIGARLQAGTGCGSCLPELRTLLAETRKVAG